MKLSKTYEPSQYESDIYALWEKSGAFKPISRGDKDSFCIVMPPPNANASLHIGMGLTVALEDIAIRYQRLRGKSALYLPGADHAGFETQSVYEKQLARAGKSRFDFSREELYSQIWNFVDENRHIFEKQVRQMGASCDWSRYVFTLDEKIVNNAYATFKKMWDEDLIYRGERLINYCTYHGTGFADIEVEHREVTGKLWTIKYPLASGQGEIAVATTRPETMLGDTAVAVHPKDPRYKKFIGHSVKLPLTSREIPIIADEFVDKGFGTGAVKVTPAHDPNDFDIGARHNLPQITVIGHDGRINRNAPDKYQNLTVKDARGKVVADLKEQGLLSGEKPHIHSVGHCYKCGTVIEPLLREQWFVDMKPLAKKAIEALKANKIKFYPQSKKVQLIRYLEGLRDWNISRQIAWGIPIPAFQSSEDPQDWIFDTRVNQETIEVDGKVYHRDQDVFDTWFSSSSWPYATLDFPGGEDFKNYYPNGLMETGGEILYPWVSRMIMMGLYCTGEVPFREVYIHGYVLAEDGSKMSKSVGNVIDPLPVIENYGSDALRMGLVAGRSPAVNRGYDQRRVEEARNFCNKLWNIARFIEGVGSQPAEAKLSSAADHWVAKKLGQASKKLASLLDKYEFSEGYELVYHLIWDDIADWYVEANKAEPNLAMLHYVLETALKLVHPYAPFVSETIWQTLHENDGSLLITSQWPKEAKFDDGKASDFANTKEVIGEIRQIKTLLNYKRGNLYFTDSPEIAGNAQFIQKMAKLAGVKQVRDGGGLGLSKAKGKCWLDIDRASAKQFVETLAKKKKELDTLANKLESRLGNPSYTKKAPKELVNETKHQLAGLREELANIDNLEKKFSKI